MSVSLEYAENFILPKTLKLFKTLKKDVVFKQVLTIL